MALLYLVIMIFVTFLLIGLPLVPFWKVRKRLRTHHPDIWAQKGPFDLRTMTAYPSAFRTFIDFVKEAPDNAGLEKKDPELVKSARLAVEVLKMMPRGFIGQIITVLVLIYFILFFTSVIHGAFSG